MKNSDVNQVMHHVTIGHIFTFTVFGSALHETYKVGPPNFMFIALVLLSLINVYCSFHKDQRATTYYLLLEHATFKT